MTRILLTGATGWVGSALAAELQARGHPLLCLVRGPGGAERLSRLLAAPAQTLDADLSRAGAGVSPADLERWRGQVDLVVHAAAVARLDEAVERERWQVNVEGTSAVLALAAALGARTFCQISSGSVAGDAASFSEEDLDVGQRFHNGYERSKLEAERRVREWPGRWLILRLPGMVGEHATGATRFYRTGTFYAVMGAYWALREELRTEWQQGDWLALQAEQIRFGSDGMLELPVHVPYASSSPCPLVPVDWMARTAADLLALDHAAGTFHLMDPSPRSLGAVFGDSLRQIRIHPPWPGMVPPEIATPWNRFIRRIFDRMVKIHLPYLGRLARYSNVRLPRTLGAGYISPPPMDEPFIRRLLDHAVAHQFSS